jgi:hypothetical protein
MHRRENELALPESSAVSRENSLGCVKESAESPETIFSKLFIMLGLLNLLRT